MCLKFIQVASIYVDPAKNQHAETSFLDRVESRPTTG